MSEGPHIVVVGAGIVGASIAYHLVHAGARVTVIDAADAGGVATRHSWAWINASWGNPESYFRLRRYAMDEWRRLEGELSTLRVGWSGALNWELPTAELEAFAAEKIAWGYGVRRVDRAEARRLEPNLVAPPEFALHVASEGAIEPLAAAQALLNAARESGATIIPRQPVRSLIRRGGRVVGIDMADRRLDADTVIVAAGVGTASLAATAGCIVKLRHSPALIVRSNPAPPVLNGLVVTPEMELRQTAEGCLLGASDFEDGESADDGPAAGARLFAAMQGMIAAGGALTLGSVGVGYRPMPEDGFPAVGPATAPGLYVAVMHSGITLAPAIGKFVADEILHGRRDALLLPYGLERFAA